jgi:hypothetical protein
VRDMNSIRVGSEWYLFPKIDPLPDSAQVFCTFTAFRSSLSEREPLSRGYLPSPSQRDLPKKLPEKGLSHLRGL